VPHAEQFSIPERISGNPSDRAGMTVVFTVDLPQ
jgi:hypothetical protein